MSLANDIINFRQPNFDFYLNQGESLDDIDEYGFTPLIECAITQQLNIAKELLTRKVDVNKPDVTGRTALHWAIDNNDLALAKLLLEHQANPNAYTSAGLPILTFPILRRQDHLKRLLYQNGAKLNFALDFINCKLLGHRFELTGDVDLLNADGEFIEVNFEGFILEFTVDIIRDSLRRFTRSYSTRHLRTRFPYLYGILDGFKNSYDLLQLQKHRVLTKEHKRRLEDLIKEPLLILPAASQGHALGFIRLKNWWVKIDRGENSLKEDSINIYQITYPEKINGDFIENFLYKKQPRNYFHQQINSYLGLVPRFKLPMTAQISGNCSWANIQAIVAAAYALQELEANTIAGFNPKNALSLYETWIEWDKDRAIDECIQRFHLAEPARQASFASQLGAVLFQACDYQNSKDLERAEKILTILVLEPYYFVLSSYLEEFCRKRLTRRGNNLLKILDDCGINSNINVTPIATGLIPRNHKSRKE